MNRLASSVVCPILVLALSCAFASLAGAADSEKAAFFENRVRPILSAHCFECHDAVKQEGGVRLDALEGMLAGGDSGPSIVPGKPEESLLVEAIRYEGYEMPPKGPLPEEDIAAIVRWIRDGAHWPAGQEPMQPALGDQDAIRAAADKHWAYSSIERPDLPTVSDPDWVRTPVDRFVLAQLESHGLKPSPLTNRPTLIRRAFIDLIGLPPTPEIIAAVFGKPSLQGLNYKEIVDGLLASPHYGERMARHWMDVARYADTRDFLAAADLRYPFAYTYRDWLIRAFNDDMPYDEFVKQQLAADFVADRPDDPDLAALGFLTVGPLFRNNVHERIADRIDTVSRGLMGVTVSCARCHDHKYDPISIEDYYSLYGVFRDSQRPDEFPTIASPLGAEPSPEQIADFEKTHAAEVAKLEAYEAGLAAEARKDLFGRFDDYLVGYVEMNIAKSETVRGLKSKRKLEETAMTPVARNLDRFRRDKSNETHPVLGPLVSLVVVPEASFTKRRDAYLKQHGNRLEPSVRAAVAKSKDRLDLAKQIGLALNRAAKSGEPPTDSPWSLAFAETPKSPFHISSDAASQASRLMGLGRRKLQEFAEAIKDVEATHPGAPPKAMALQDAKDMRPVFVFFRGEPARRGPRVERGFPDYFSGKTKSSFENGSGRLELAEQICSPTNPLTSRVLVNRIWRMHFGAGLVRDAGDFGLRSDPPIQEALIDYLASTLTSTGWSIKDLHRTIMLSNTYRQTSSQADPPMRSDGTSAAEIDAENKLLWRQNRRRLDFETMRDSMLAAAGTIDLAIGGKSVKLSETPHPKRRTLYAYIDRVEPDPVFATFDVASPDVATAQRTETLVPQQALFAMNNPFVTEQARAMVASSEFANAGSAAKKVDRLVQRVLQRPARPNEVAMVIRFVQQADGLMEDQAAEWQYGYGPSASGTEEFTPLSHFDGKRYTFEPTFPSPKAGFVSLTNWGGHPGGSSEKSAIRRWIATDTMLIRIGGLLERKSDRGDGIRGVVRINGKPVYDVELTTGQQKTAVGFHKVNEGDRVDFIVDPLKTATSDSFRWTVVIERREKGREDAVETYYSGREFAGPPPPPLSPWEQAAQALLLTNEFLFVD